MHPRLKLIGLCFVPLLLSLESAVLPNPRSLFPTFADAAPSIDRKLEADRLLKQGEQLFGASRFQEALQSYEKALSIYQKMSDLTGQAKTLNNLAFTDQYLSQFGKAIEVYQQALPLFQQLHDLNGEANVLTRLGIAHWSLSQNKKAIEYYQKALPLFQQIHDRDGEAYVLLNLGNIYESPWEYNKAIEYYQKALSLFQQTQNHLQEANTLMNFGNIYYNERFQYLNAIEYYQKALLIFQQIKNPNGEANALGNLANAYDALSDSQSDEAIEHYQRALFIFQKIGNRDREGRTLGNIGKLLRKQDKPELAIVFYKQSINIYESIKGGLKTLPREQQQSYVESVASTYRELADLLIQKGRLSEAQAVLELLKLRELRDFTRDVGINSSGINLAKIEEIALKQILNRFTTIANFNQQLSDCEHKKCANLTQLQEQRDRLNEAVNTELQQQRAILAKHFSTESATLTPEKLNAEARRIVNAQPGTVLIYPLVLKDKLQFLLALKAENGAFTFRPVEVPNVTADTLFNKIQEFRTQLKEPTNLKDLQATSQQLYDWLIKPLEPELNNPNIKHLVFAPDSTIRYIPLAALYNGKQYLVERYSISTITAASKTDTTETLASLPINSSFLLAMGASIFPNFSPLPNVPNELAAIVKDNTQKDTHGIYPGSKALNTQFSFDTLKEKLKGHRILHIATHGAFVSGRPEDSYLVPGQGNNLTTDRIDQLLNYGIGDVHLVVLSACETAVGDRASDGIEIPGISYFFLKNEVKSVLASLWSVNDNSTALLMQRFYQKLATRKVTKAEALQQIQQEFIRGNLTAKDAPSRARLDPKEPHDRSSPANSNYSHPYYWAPFILIGNNL